MRTQLEEDFQGFINTVTEKADEVMHSITGQLSVISDGLRGVVRAGLDYLDEQTNALANMVNEKIKEVTDMIIGIVGEKITSVQK